MYIFPATHKAGKTCNSLKNLLIIVNITENNKFYEQTKTHRSNVCEVNITMYKSFTCK